MELNKPFITIKQILLQTGDQSSRVSLSSRKEEACLALVGHSPCITIKLPYGLDFLLNRPGLHPFLSC